MEQRWVSCAPEEVLTHFDSDASGLSQAVALKRLSGGERNEILVRGASFFRILLKQYGNFLMLLLAFGVLLSFYLGQFVDGLVILITLLVNGVLGTIQEYRAERFAAALSVHVPQMAVVRRDGKEMVIARADIVAGDIVILSSGQLVPADMRVIKNFGLLVDESMLTGESVPVAKQAEAVHSLARRRQEMANMVFSGTLVVDGACEAVVVATGNRTEFGNVVAFSHRAKKASSFLAQINGLSRFLFDVSLVAAAVLLFVLVFLKPDFGLNTIFLFVTALAIGVVPEMLPLISTVALTRASLELVKRGVFVKRLSALEDLGGVDILCTDKTGTITENKLHVVDVLAEDKERCVRYALYGVPSSVDKNFHLTGSFDAAIRKKASNKLREAVAGAEKLWDGAFEPSQRWQFAVVKEHGDAVLSVKGAPESVLAHCAMSEKERQVWLKDVSLLGAGGKRVLAVAVKSVSVKKDYTHEAITHLEFVGCVVFEDRIKSTAKLAFEQAQHIGVKIKILTGDAPEVALHVAQAIGMEVTEQDMITGFDIMNLSLQERIDRIGLATIFARVSPEQKYEIVQIIARKSSVMFLGEGINDAPALKTADVGVVVQDASDIAKESADIVLTKPDLAVIIESIHFGRQIMSSIMKYIMITLTGNFGSMYAIGVAAVIAPILPLLPTQVLLQNILTDIPMVGAMTSSLGRHEQRKPVHYSIRGISFAAIILGLVVFSSQMVFYFLIRNLPDDLFRTLWFLEVILFEFGLIISLRTTHWFWKGGRLTLGAKLLFLLVAVFGFCLPFIPVLNHWFHLVPYSVSFLAPIFLIVLVGISIVELVKRILFRANFFSRS